MFFTVSMVNGTNYVSCPELWQIDFSCEMSNHATMVVELLVALMVAIIIGGIFYYREYVDESKKKKKHTFQFFYSLRNKFVKLIDKNKKFQFVSRNEILELIEFYGNNEVLIEDYIQGKERAEINSLFVKLRDSDFSGDYNEEGFGSALNQLDKIILEVSLKVLE